MDKIGQLKGLLSKMKIDRRPVFMEKIVKLGNSDMFSYATNPKFKQDELKRQKLQTWDRFEQYDIKNSAIRLPLNGFEEMILLTEQGKLWHYPIDNEQGMEAEQQVPFEEHVFLDEALEEFPQNEYVQTFMGFVLLGLAKNNYMTVARKQEIIKFYREYFEEHRDSYKEGGFDM